MPAGAAPQTMVEYNVRAGGVTKMREAGFMADMLAARDERSAAEAEAWSLEATSTARRDADVVRPRHAAMLRMHAACSAVCSLLTGTGCDTTKGGRSIQPETAVTLAPTCMQGLATAVRVRRGDDAGGGQKKHSGRAARGLPGRGLAQRRGAAPGAAPRAAPLGPRGSGRVGEGSHGEPPFQPMVLVAGSLVASVHAVKATVMYRALAQQSLYVYMWKQRWLTVPARSH